jgi:thymidylate kinase
MALILIEGDNGVGKTTVSRFFADTGYFIVTDDPAAKNLETDAKKFAAGTIERTEAFIAYNKFCGEKATEYQNSLIARYWISTVSASYADGPYSLEEAARKASELYNELPRPDFIFRLQCSREERMVRLAKRNSATHDTSDDISIARDERYQKILDRIGNIVNNWHDINTVGRSPEQIFLLMTDIINSSTEKGEHENVGGICFK